MVDIIFTRDRLRRFKDAYDLAVSREEDTFVFEGHVVFTSYAKYIIEYATGELRED